MNFFRWSLFVLALSAISEPAVAQQAPAAAQQVPTAGQVRDKNQATLRQSPGGLATPGSVNEQADLLRAQTEAIKALAQKVDALEARVNAVEAKMKVKTPN